MTAWVLKGKITFSFDLIYSISILNEVKAGQSATPWQLAKHVSSHNLWIIPYEKIENKSKHE